MTYPRIPVRRVFRIINGGTPTSDPTNWGGEIPWVTPADLTDTFAVISGTGRNITQEGAKSGSSVVPASSLIISTRAPIGKVAITQREMAFNQGCRALIPHQGGDMRYFGYQFEGLKEQLNSHGLGTTFTELSSEGLASIRVWVPPVEEQRRIADFLDAETSRIDQLIGASLCQTQLLDEHLHETIRSCTTLGLPGREYHSASTSIDWMPTINATWRLHKVAHNFISGSGTTPPSANENYYGGDIPWVNSADVVDSEIWSTSRKITQNALRDFAALKVHPAGSLVIALYGQGNTKGRVGILRIDATVNQACCALLPISNLSTEYSFYWFRAHKSGVITLAQGAGQPNLSQQLIQQLYIPAPTPQEQNKIVDYLDKMERQIKSQTHLIEKRISLLEERRRALITAAVTGEFDVSTASGRGIED